MLGTLTKSKALSHWPWLGDFLAGERRAWIFVSKTLLALYLAAWLAMWLQLEQPSTTMTTVAIVMNPHSGMVLAKSFYRVIGTLAGSFFGLVLMALFPQQRELFLLSLSLWVGLCAGGATFYRNFMSYGFVLSGYTAVIIVLPAINNPLTTFDSAVMRVSEVMLGVVVAGLVSGLVLPEHLRQVLRQSGRKQFMLFVDHVRGTSGSLKTKAEMEQARFAFVGAAVRLEDMRASVIFEDPEVYARSAHVRALNQRSMVAGTTYLSLHQLVNRLQRSGSNTVVEALITLYQSLNVALSPEPAQQYDSAILTARLTECLTQLPVRSAVLRESLTEPTAQLAFDTGVTLLQRFTAEMRDFVTLRESLLRNQLQDPVEKVYFYRANDIFGAAIAVLRTSLTMMALSAFWLAGGWTFGATAMLMATIFSGILASAPNPIKAAINTLSGYVVGIVAGLVVVYGLLPGNNDFAALVGASAGILMIGPYLTTRLAWAGIGTGYLLGIVNTLSLKNPMIYDPVSSINNGIAQTTGFAMAALSFVIIPTFIGTHWQRVRQMHRLRHQVILTANLPLKGLTWRFESICRDLFQQMTTHTPPDSAEARSFFAWGLAVQESGRAILELRQYLNDTPNIAPALRAATTTATHAIGSLYDQPNVARWRRADEALRRAITTAIDVPTVHQYLYELHSALHDDESPLAAYISTASGDEK